MSWKFNTRIPVFMQIVRRLRADILMGKYAAEEQIPSVRQLAFEASVNPNTVQRALTCLETEGLLYTRGTVGRFVTGDEQVLRHAKERMHREILEELVSDALAMGIEREELISFIQEIKETKEETTV